MSPLKRDIASLEDIVHLVDKFYEGVRADEILVPFLMRLPTPTGISTCRFWQTVLFGASAFRGNPLLVHRDLARRVPLGESEFERWLSLFCQSVDALFSGPRAEHPKIRASRIAAVMQHHILIDGEAVCSAQTS